MFTKGGRVWGLGDRGIRIWAVMTVEVVLFGCWLSHTHSLLHAEFPRMKNEFLHTKNTACIRPTTQMIHLPQILYRLLNPSGPLLIALSTHIKKNSTTNAPITIPTIDAGDRIYFFSAPRIASARPCCWAGVGG